MKKTFYFLRNLEPAYGGSVLLMMAVFFVFGAVLGSMAASGVLSSGSGRMYEMLTSYLLCYAGSYEHPSFFSALFVNFRYHALIFFISFIGYGVFFVPFVVMFRGFFYRLRLPALSGRSDRGYFFIVCRFRASNRSFSARAFSVVFPRFSICQGAV